MEKTHRHGARFDQATELHAYRVPVCGEAGDVGAPNVISHNTDAQSIPSCFPHDGVLSQGNLLVPDALRSAALERDSFIETYGIKHSGGGRVLVTLDGTSAIDFLHRVQKLSSALYGRDHCWPATLARWATEEAFKVQGATVQVDATVPQSTGLTAQEQQSQGYNNVGLEELAVAHGAFFILSGRDLFDGMVVRARDGALYFSPEGLDISRYATLGYNRNRNVGASRWCSGGE